MSDEVRGMSDEVLAHTAHGVAEIRLNRPAKKNAITVAMYAALADLLAAAEADRAVRAILIGAEGDAFTAGNDLADFLERPPGSSEDSPVFRFMRAIHGAAKPVVAAVGGVAVGIGVTMLLHCDLVVASRDARFQTPFASLGLVPEAGSSLLLPQLVGGRRAAEMLLLGEMIGADTAREFGLVNRVVEPAALDAAARAMARTLAEKPPAAVRLTKRLMRPDPGVVLERMAAENALFGERLGSGEAREAIEAFFARRPPDFSRFG